MNHTHAQTDRDAAFWVRWVVATAIGVLVAFAGFVVIFEIFGEPDHLLFPLLMPAVGACSSVPATAAPRLASIWRMGDRRRRRRRACGRLRFVTDGVDIIGVAPVVAAAVTGVAAGPPDPSAG